MEAEATEVLTDEVMAVLDEPWRLEPHSFAEEMSGGRWKAWRHLRYIGERIAAAIVRGGGRLIVNLPPGHGKSSLISLWLPIWFLDNLPRKKVIMVSHGADLAVDWGRQVRNEFERNERLTTKLAPDSQAAGRWNTKEGGGMMAVGVDGGVTGWRGNLILVDDPHPTWQDAMSITHRTHVAEWFDGTLYDRQEPGATVVVLMHRWHEDDLAGHLISQHTDKWEVISLPAIAEKGDLLGRQEGEALCPERYPVAELLKFKAPSELVWCAKYQQRPRNFGIGRIYDHFDPAAHEDKNLKLRLDLPLDVSFDFNRNPGMHVEIGQYDLRNDFFTCVHEVHGPMMKLQAAMEETKKVISQYGDFPWPLLRIFADATGTQQRAETTDTAYQQVETWAKKSGWPYRTFVPKANPPVVDRIEAFNEALRDSDGDIHYRVHPTQCPRLCADLRDMRPDEFGMIDKKNLLLSHASDAEGYRIHQLRPIVRRAKVNTGSSSVATANYR